jgi:putative transcriptional regulator
MGRGQRGGGAELRNRLKALREGAGWTQAALADRLDVSRQTVNALETGRYDPSLPLAFRISRLFAVPIEQMFFPDEPPQGGTVDQVANNRAIASTDVST